MHMELLGLSSHLAGEPGKRAQMDLLEAVRNRGRLGLH
jgi:hypothetical protein